MNQARIIYVTGMKPKPAPEVHVRELTRVLAAGIARTRPENANWLRERAENFTLVSWTSELYDYRRDISLDLPGIERLLAEPYPSAADCREIDSVQRRVTRLWHLFGDSVPWLTHVMASRALQLTLADVHRYLENRDGVAVRIRNLLEDAIVDAWSQSQRVMLIGHSLGSVLAYDTLWELSRERRHPGRIDHFLTLGSPLATRFIRKSLQGAEHRGPERYPDNIRRWTNISSRGEMVALHPRIKPFFAEIVEMGLVEFLEDRSEIYNHFRGATGLDVHKSYGYLNHSEVAGLVGDWIGAPD